MKKKFMLVFVAVFALLASSCQKKSIVVNSADAIQLTVHDFSNDFVGNSTSSYSDKKICVVFGYGYNSDEFVSNMKTEFSNKFGLAENSGLVLPLVYPNDFKTAGRNRISMLSDILDNYQLKGLIILGAPENTHNAVFAIKNKYDGNIPYPIFSFFPQDEVLGMEFVSDFVLEKVQKTANFESEEEVVITEEIPTLLLSAVNYMSFMESPLLADSSLVANVQKIVGNAGKITHYIDPESGLQARNHFVLN